MKKRTEFLSSVVLYLYIIVYVTELTRVSTYRHVLIVATSDLLVCKVIGNPRLGRERGSQASPDGRTQCQSGDI